MTIVTLEDELQNAVFEIIEPPKEKGSIILTLKIKEELSEVQINQLKAVGARVMTPVK